MLDYPVGTRCCCNVAIMLQSGRDVAQHKYNVATTSTRRGYTLRMFLLRNNKLSNKHLKFESNKNYIIFYH